MIHLKQHFTGICMKCEFSSEFEVNTEITGSDDPELQAHYIGDWVITLRCPKCGTKLTNVDPLIAEQILKLNRLGYPTQNSCQGHRDVMDFVYEDDDTLVEEDASGDPYVQFDEYLIYPMYKLWDIAWSVAKDFPAVAAFRMPDDHDVIRTAGDAPLEEKQKQFIGFLNALIKRLEESDAS